MEKKNIKDKEKFSTYIIENSIICKCTNRVPLYTFKRYGDYSICNWCGKRVYKTKDEQQKYEFKTNLLKQLKMI